jgi:hypothetical protein
MRSLTVLLRGNRHMPEIEYSASNCDAMRMQAKHLSLAGPRLPLNMP